MTARVFRKARYLLRGVRAMTRPRRCPCCAAYHGERIDRKWVFTLWSCGGCGILYRHPRDSAEQQNEYYQQEYPGVDGRSSMMPSEAEFEAWVQSGYTGAGTDFRPVLRLLQALGVPRGARVLDFGCNWGYGVFQLRQAGYDAVGFEISLPRASYGEQKLGVRIAQDPTALHAPFDVVYSRHVLEHVPNALETLRVQLELLRQGGLLMAHTPNGSSQFRQAAFPSFHRLWGEMHPVLLTETFVERALHGHALYLASDPDATQVASWNGRDRANGRLDGYELLFVARK